MKNEYIIKRFGNKGDYRLNGLQNVEHFDAFVSEVNNASRLWIEDRKVFATSEDLQSQGDYIRFKCEIDPNYESKSSQCITFYGKKLKSLASTVETILCLPDYHQGRVIELSGLAGGANKSLIFSPTQLKSVLSAHVSRSYMFTCFDLSPEQSVILAKNNLEGIRFCSISDKGKALVNHLEHRNEARTLGCYLYQFPNAWNNIASFLGRSTYPVFEELFLDPYHAINSDRCALLVQANVKSISVTINPYIIAESDFKPLLHALYEGTLVAPKLAVCFENDDRDMDDDDLDFYELAIQGLFVALSSAHCQLKDLHLKVLSASIRTVILVVDEFLPRMLKKNKSLETLGIDFLEMGLLNAVENHPRLRTVVTVPPSGHNPPRVGQGSFLEEWYRKHLFHQIRFEDSTKILLHEGRRVVTKGPVDKWQDFLFFCRLELLRQVKDERIRSHMLIAALANHSTSLKRVHLLLSENLDVFCQMNLGSSCVSP